MVHYSARCQLCMVIWIFTVLAAGCDTRRADVRARAVQHCSSMRNSGEVMNAVDAYGRTPLHYCMLYEGHTSTSLPFSLPGHVFDVPTE